MNNPERMNDEKKKVELTGIRLVEYNGTFGLYIPAQVVRTSPLLKAGERYDLIIMQQKKEDGT